MSLIVTSSTQEQYGGLNATRTLTGIEDPAAYSNHFKSPLELPIDSEIAVESVKIRRGALFDIEDDSVMYQYFGKEQTLVGRAGKQERVSMPIPIKPKRGVYSVGEFAEELEARLDESYGNPEIFGGHSVDRQTDGAGTVTGFSMSTVQKGNASLAAQDRKAIMSGLRDTGVGLQYWSGLRSLTDGAPGITATATATSAVITRTAATSGLAGKEALDDRKASIIGTKFPMGLVQGLFWVETIKATKGWRVGLSRQQLEYQTNSVGPAGGPATAVDPDDPNFVPVLSLARLTTTTIWSRMMVKIFGCIKWHTIQLSISLFRQKSTIIHLLRERLWPRWQQLRGMRLMMASISILWEMRFKSGDL